MTTIGSTHLQGAGNHYQSREKVGSDDLTDSQRFTKDHAQLSASEYAFAKMVFMEQQSAERIASGEAGHIFTARLDDRVFTFAGDTLDVSLLSPIPDAEAQWAYARTEGANSAAASDTYDFSNMSRQELADAGKELFRAGKITLDELFLLDHPDGVLRVDTNGDAVEFDPEQRFDFLAELREAIRTLELAGSARNADSFLNSMAGLLDKLAGTS